MAAGVPVIASTAGRCPKWSASGGLLLEPDDVDAWRRGDRAWRETTWARRAGVRGPGAAQDVHLARVRRTPRQAYREALARRGLDGRHANRHRRTRAPGPADRRRALSSQILGAWTRLPGAPLTSSSCVRQRSRIWDGHRWVSRLSASGHGTAWEQLVLPRLIWKARANVLFAPAYTAPLACSIPVVVTVHDVSFVAHPEWFSWREGFRRRLDHEGKRQTRSTCLDAVRFHQARGGASSGTSDSSGRRCVSRHDYRTGRTPNASRWCSRRLALQSTPHSGAHRGLCAAGDQASCGAARDRRRQSHDAGHRR